jgi:hypothetical protein
MDAVRLAGVRRGNGRADPLHHVGRGLASSIGVRVNCVVSHWIGLERAHEELAVMSPEERAAAPPFADPEGIAEAVVLLVEDESLAGRVVEMRGGQPPRLLGTGTEED